MIELITYTDFKKLLDSSRSQYYKGRWEYFKKVIDIIKNENVTTVLELGPGLLPIVKNTDIMVNPQEDQFGQPTKYYKNKIIHDATVKPWPIKDKFYDLFIGLQVMEHLDNKQSLAFREIQRISKMVILSFPYLWTGGEEKISHRLHRNIDKQLISDWTLNFRPEKIIEVKRTGEEFNKGPRIIYVWKF